VGEWVGVAVEGCGCVGWFVGGWVVLRVGVVVIWGGWQVHACGLRGVVRFAAPRCALAVVWWWQGLVGGMGEVVGSGLWCVRGCKVGVWRVW